jgi:hypothetical protein
MTRAGTCGAVARVAAPALVAELPRCDPPCAVALADAAWPAADVELELELEPDVELEPAPEPDVKSDAARAPVWACSAALPAAAGDLPPPPPQPAIRTATATPVASRPSAVISA